MVRDAPVEEQALAAGVVRAGAVADILPPAVQARRALRPGAGQYQPANQGGPGEGYVLGDDAGVVDRMNCRP